MIILEKRILFSNKLIVIIPFNPLKNKFTKTKPINVDIKHKNIEEK